MWQLKSFWYAYPSISSKLEHDIECHPFDSTSAEPAIQYDQCPPVVKMIVNEMRNHRDALYKAIEDGSYHEVRDFALI
jgi:hypothetical protein